MACFKEYEMIQLITNCLVCNAEEKYILPRYAKNYLVRCENCSFVFCQRRPTKEELERVYGGYNYVGAEATVATTEKKQKIAKHLLQLRGIDNGSVLDIGCGKGEWLDTFKQLGLHTFGTEFNSDLAQFGVSKGHQMLDGGLFPTHPDGKGFDLIIFTEVIEHIQNPVEVLRHLNRLLNPDGLIFITTPNFQAIERYLLGEAWGMICYPEHLSYFTPRTLKRALAYAGYSELHMYTENISVFRIT
jgi:SAM-dependent methyltransferase